MAKRATFLAAHHLDLPSSKNEKLMKDLELHEVGSMSSLFKIIHFVIVLH